MAKYALIYKGGNSPQTPEEQKTVTNAWVAWFTQLGPAVVDPGNPFGPAQSIAPSGVVSDGGSGATGYSVIEAGDLATATELAKGCPHLQAEGTVEVYETYNVM